MDSSRIDSGDERTFLLIRLPRETVNATKELTGLNKVGTVSVDTSNCTVFRDDYSGKVYNLVRNEPTAHKTSTTNKKESSIVANEESDLFRISLHRDEAIHIGKVKSSTLLSVPKDGAIGVSAVSD